MQHHVKKLTRPNWKRLLLSGYPADPSKGKAGKTVFYTLYLLSICFFFSSFMPSACFFPSSYNLEGSTVLQMLLWTAGRWVPWHVLQEP